MSSLFRKFFPRKPPDGLVYITDRVYVFDCCFSMDVLEDDKYKLYMGGIVGQLCDHFADASFMLFNFLDRERRSRSQIANILSAYDMTIMDYPQHYEHCPLLTMKMIHHFLRSSESWLSFRQQNLLLMHCECGGWPVLAFMLACLLKYRKQYTGEQKILEMIYKKAPRELLQLLSPLNPLPSQLRYLLHVSRRNVDSESPPLENALTLDCIIFRTIPNFDSEGGCRPIFRVYGQDPFREDRRTSKLLFSTPRNCKTVQHYKQAECEFFTIDIHCHIQGDVVLECVSLDDDLEGGVMMFRVMFNTAFIWSDILMLNRDEIDIKWDVKDRFPKDFRAEVLFTKMDVDLLDPKQNTFQQISSPSICVISASSPLPPLPPPPLPPPPPPLPNFKHTGPSRLLLLPPPPKLKNVVGPFHASPTPFSGAVSASTISTTVSTSPPPPGKTPTSQSSSDVPPISPMDPFVKAVMKTGVPPLYTPSLSVRPKEYLLVTSGPKMHQSHMQGSLWRETQKSDETSKPFEFNMSELGSLYSPAVPSDHGNSGDKSSCRASVETKSDEDQLSMEHSRNFEENLQDLMQELNRLKRVADELGKKGERQVDLWLQNVESSKRDMDELQKEVSEIEEEVDELRSMELNKKVIQSLNVVKTLKEDAFQIFLHDIIGDKLKRLSHADLDCFTSKFSRQIGSGGFGKVYLGQFPNDGFQVAVKVLMQNEVVEEIFMVEVNTMLKASHPNLIKLYGFCFDSNTKALVYEYMEKGSLDRILYKKPLGIKWEKLYDIAIEIAKVLAYLHHGCEDQIIHHDLKPANVLLDSNLSAKVTDFGTARIMSRDVGSFTMTKIRGTRGYTAPEMILQSSRVTCTCDVYSFGMMLFDFLGMRNNNFLPGQVWEKLRMGKLDEIIMESSIGHRKNDIDKARILSVVALWCVQFTPHIRPSMINVVHALEKELSVTMPPDPSYSWKTDVSMELSPEMNCSVSPSTDERTQEEVLRI